MHNHFDQFLNVRELLLERKPYLMVECGGASGENTRQLLSLIPEFPSKLYTISDAPFHPEWEWAKGTNGSFTWLYDLSWRALSKFVDGTIDFCSIDTDHNYSTMKRELDALHPKLRAGGLVVMHDTETYGKNAGGYADRYGTGDPYDRGAMEAEAQGRGMGDAIFEFLRSHPEYIIVRQTPASHGAMALEKTHG